MSQYFARCREMNDTLRLVNMQRDEPALVTLLLGGLSREYDTIVQIIDNMPALPSITDVPGKLMTAERTMKPEELRPTSATSDQHRSSSSSSCSTATATPASASTATSAVTSSRIAASAKLT